MGIIRDVMTVRVQVENAEAISTHLRVLAETHAWLVERLADDAEAQARLKRMGDAATDLARVVTSGGER